MECFQPEKALKVLFPLIHSQSEINALEDAVHSLKQGQ